MDISNLSRHHYHWQPSANLAKCEPLAGHLLPIYHCDLNADPDDGKEMEDEANGTCLKSMLYKSLERKIINRTYEFSEREWRTRRGRLTVCWKVGSSINAE